MANKRQKKKQQKKLKNPSYTGYSSTDKYNDRDKEYYNKVQDDIQYQQRFSQAYMTYEEILSKVDTIRSLSPEIADKIENKLDSIIESEGLEGLVNRIATAEDRLLEELDRAILYLNRGDNRFTRHVSAFLSLLNKGALSASEARMVADASEDLSVSDEV